MKSMPPLGMLDQQSSLHLDLIYALAIPKREAALKPLHSTVMSEVHEEKIEECEEEDRFSQRLQDMTLEMTSDLVQEQKIIDLKEEESVAQDFSALSLNESDENALPADEAKCVNEDQAEHETASDLVHGEELPVTEVEDLSELPISDSILLAASECTTNDEPSMRSDYLAP